MGGGPSGGPGMCPGRIDRVDLYAGDCAQFPIAGEAKLFALSDGVLAA